MEYIISPENTTLSASTYNLTVYLEQNFDDIGFYSVTDGDIIQEKDVCNFTYTLSGNTITIFNSVNRFSKNLSNVTFTIYWGDAQSEDVLIEEQVSHIYTTTGTYELTLKLETPWTDNIKKTITTGSYTVLDPLGTLTIDIPFSVEEFDQNYIDHNDSECQSLEQDDIYVSGFTASRLSEFALYGGGYVEGLNDDGNGVVNITDEYISYIIDTVLYIDFLLDGLTYYNVNVGDNPQEIVCSLLSKDEAMMGVVEDITIQSDVYVERGKISVFEHNLRLTEINSVGELEVYGNHYFNVKE